MVDKKPRPKKVNIYVSLDGVTVTKMQTKKKVSEAAAAGCAEH